MSQGWSNQWLHFLLGLSGIPLGLLVALLARPASWIPALVALLPGYIIWTIVEHFSQWPISPTSDHRLDTIFHTLGRYTAAVVCGVVAHYLHPG